MKDAAFDWTGADTDPFFDSRRRTGAGAEHYRQQHRVAGWSPHSQQPLQGRGPRGPLAAAPIFRSSRPS
jgi:hypothetical protein